MPDDPFRPVGQAKPNRIGGTPEWRLLMPVPQDAPAPPREHYQLGLPHQVHRYADAEGQLLGFVYRFQLSDGSKQFFPLTFRENKSGKREWRWKSWEDPRPLYGLDVLAKHHDGIVLVVEGEKSADAALALTGLPAVSCAGGSNAGGKANWQPVTGRDVVIWPDADEPGAKHAEIVAKLAKLAGARSVRIVAPPADVVAGWDVADAADEGWSKARALGLVGAATPAGAKPGGSKKADRSDETRRPRQRDSLISSAEGAVLWHSPAHVAYATIVAARGHREHHRLDSKAFGRWLSGRYYEQTEFAPSAQMLSDAMRVLELKAMQGPEFEPAMRTAWHDGASWVDLCDDSWRAVKITAAGWEVVSDPPVHFVRTETMKALPEPEAGELLEKGLRRFVNADDPDYILIVSFLVAALWGRGRGYPVLALGGEQGAGKTTMARALRMLVDPSAVPAISMPRDERDLVAMAMSGHVLSFDNVSKIDHWFSDSICRLATGTGFLARKLHTDGEAFFFHGSRPVVLNGIPALTDRADLADRALTISLRAIPEGERRSEFEWWAEFEAALPRIFGALLDAIASAVRTIDHVRLPKAPRMADFATLMAAAEPGLGWEPGTFEAAYDENRKATADAAFEADPVAMAVDALMKERPHGWEGTASMLLGELNVRVSEDMRRSKFWPTKANALGSALRRAAPLLRRKGIEITDRHTGDARYKTITRRS